MILKWVAISYLTVFSNFARKWLNFGDMSISNFQAAIFLSLAVPFDLTDVLNPMAYRYTSRHDTDLL